MGCSLTDDGSFVIVLFSVFAAVACSLVRALAVREGGGVRRGGGADRHPHIPNLESHGPIGASL